MFCNAGNAMRLKITGLMILGCLLSMSAGATQPWYSAELVATGSQLFQQHCAECHGANAEGTSEWKKTDATGHYPPPPLNGSAHAWHHSIPQLARSIKQGGQQLGGVMPGFADKLDDQQILALIAFFQSKWPTEIYDRWHNRHMQ
jgi:mono/diheme cytochrome c family protein